MNEWTGWAAALLGFLLSYVGWTMRTDKKRFEDNSKRFEDNAKDLTERVVKLETQVMTEKEVRNILKEYFDPFMSEVTKIREDLHAVNVTIAKLPKRRGDD